MKTTNWIFLLPLVAVMACGGKKEVEQQEQESEVVMGTQESEVETEAQESVRVDVPLLTKERVAELWEGVPDHGLNQKTESCLSASFYTLVDLAFAMPSDSPGEIGSEDFLWYWYRGNDDVEDDHIVEIRMDEVSDVSAKVTVTYGITPHTLVLIPETRSNTDGQRETVWVIDDFDEMHKAVYEYVDSLGRKFKEGLAERIVYESEYASWMTDEEKVIYLEAVDDFLEKLNLTFPDGVVKIR